MRMELIQPFINAADAVFAESLQAPTKIVDLSMDEEYLSPQGRSRTNCHQGRHRRPRHSRSRAGSGHAGRQASCRSPVPESEQVVRETVCELANMVIGNSVTLLNDQGFRFKVFPPEIHMSEEGLAGNVDTEAMVICIETPCGEIYLNIAMHYLHRRRREQTTVSALD